MPRTSAMDSGEQKVLDDVHKFGWHCVKVLGDAQHEQFTYTIGLFHSYGHPELLIYGLPHDVAHAVLSIAAEAAASGKGLDLSVPTNKLLEGYACVFVPVPLAEYAEHFGSARWYYEGDHFSVQQVAWPSKEGLFPWHPGASAAFRAKQPILGQHERSA